MTANPSRPASACLFALLGASTVLSPATLATHDIPEETLTLDELINLSDEDLAKVDIATMNLVCTEGLPGSQRVDRKALLAKLDLWAGYVAYETERHRYRFEQNPEEYNHSWGEFAMLMMAMTLQQDLGVRYNPDQITPEDDPTGFDFTRSQDLFINGLLNGTGGTCTSMPVLYIAVGRRLGYPLKLVTAVDHSFLRWDDPETGERFNIEGTSRGYGSYSDDHYRSWPREWGDDERRSNYLESLTPRQELAVFLTTRGDNLFFSGRLRDSLRCYDIACKMSPRNYSANYQYKQTLGIIKKLAERLRAERAAREAEEFFQQHERRRRCDPRLFVPGIPAIPTAHPVSQHPPSAAQQAHARLFPTAIPMSQGRPPALEHVGPTPPPWTRRHSQPWHSWTPVDAIIASQQIDSIMPEVDAYVAEQNRRTAELARFVYPIIHKTSQPSVPGEPRAYIPNSAVSPIAPGCGSPYPVAEPFPPQERMPTPGTAPGGPGFGLPNRSAIPSVRHPGMPNDYANHMIPRPGVPNYGVRP